MKIKLLILLTMFMACIVQVKGEVEILVSTSEVTVGTGTSSTRDAGLVSYYKNSSSQTLYLANELGHSGTIKEIAYHVNSITAKEFTGRIKIYMAETDKTNLTSENRITSKAGMTLVYDSGEGRYTGPTGTGWETFILDNPYTYYGRNLIVVTEVSKNEYNGSLYYAYSSGSNLSIVKHSDPNASYGDAFNTTAYNSANRLNTRFKIAAENKSVTTNVAGITGVNRAIGFGAYYAANASQSLYLASEIGQSGMISQMALELSTCDGTTPGTVKVYMAETENTTLTENNMFTSASQMTCVFDGDVILGKNTNGWEVLNFTTPFFYSGKKNLVVAISTTRETEKNNFFRTFQVNDRQVKSNTSSDVFGTTLAAYGYIPKIRFAFTDESAISGTGTHVNLQLGLSDHFSKMATQSLYLASEVGHVGCITKLSYQYASVGDESSNSLQVYMAETCEDALTTSNLRNSGDMSIVYNGNINLGGSGVKVGDWIEITLDKPFHYSGTGNLVIAISRTGTRPNPDKKCTFYATQTADVRTLTTTSYTEPGKADYPWKSTPNVRFSFAIHDCGTTYSSNGFGVCKNCQEELQYVFKTPTDITGSKDYRISNVGELMWFSRAVNLGQAGTSYWGYLSNDIDLTGYNWIPIGNDTNPMKSRLYGYDRGTTVGHTISGIPATGSLFGTFQGNLYSLRLTNGILVNNSNSGTINNCLTLGSALVKSGTATINNSYYLSTSTTDAAKGARTAAQMKSGQVTYELSQSSNSKWYQTIGTDNYPMVSGTSKVYRYTQCPSTTKYTNDASLSETVQGHSLVNTVCSKCNAQPTTLTENVELDRTKAYARTVQAQMASGKKLTYKRAYDTSDVNKWQSFYVPFAMQYTEAYSNQFDIAEIQDFGVFEDTNGDGDINTKDEKKLAASYLEVGSITKPNTAYLIRPKSNSTITFESCDGKVYPNTLNSIELSTMKDKVVITPTYTPVTTSGAKKQLEGGALKSSTSTLYTFSWYATPSYRNGNTWDQDTINIYAHRFGWTELVDNESNTYTQASEQIVDNLRYERAFVDRQAHNWQAMYLPFDVVVEESGDDVYPKYAVIKSVTTEGAVDYINVHKCVAGDTISANTPALVCVDRAQTLTYEYSLATLKPAISTQKILKSDRASYTFTGVYAPYQSTSTWYAIAKGDGTFHKAGSGAKLPPYRFYMTYTSKVNSAELRFAFRGLDEESETGITDVSADEDEEMIFTLDGRRAQEESLQPGIYVKNGKKVRIQ